MSKCDISVSLQKSTFLPGEEIAGEVLVKVHEPFLCNALSVILEWRTSGKGNTASDAVETRVVFRGQHQPGEHRYPFSFVAPRGPFSYQGKLINVDWYIRATADISWATDPKGEAKFTLSPPPEMSDTEPYFFGPAYKTKNAKAPGNQEDLRGTLVRWGALLGSALTFLFGVFGLDSTAKNEPSRDPTALPSATGAPPQSKTPLWLILLFVPVFLYFWVIILGVMLMLGAVILPIRGLYRWMIQSKIGTPQIQTSQRVVCRGDKISITIAFSAKEKISFGKMEVSLLCQESATRGSGKNSTTYREIVYQDRAPLVVEEQKAALDAYRDAPEQKIYRAAQKNAQGGETYVLQATLPIAEAIPYTFQASSNHVNNSLKAHIEMLNWPDWREDIPLTVRPGRRRER